MGHMIRTNGNAEEHSNGHAGKAVGIEHIPELTEAAVASAEQIPFTQQMLRDGALIFITVSQLRSSFLQQSPASLLSGQLPSALKLHAL